MDEIKILAVVSKLTVDEKKAVLQLEIASGSWDKIPKLSEEVGEFVNVCITDAD